MVVEKGKWATHRVVVGIDPVKAKSVVRNCLATRCRFYLIAPRKHPVSVVSYHLPPLAPSVRVSPYEVAVACWLFVSFCDVHTRWC